VLIELIREDIPPVGCIIMSGNNTTLYTVRGTEITQHINIEGNLPNKHGRGGQSKLRFERLAEEARHNYISKIIEIILRIYPSDLPLIVGGPASLKDKMSERLSEISTAPKIIRVVDIQYDKKQGLYELLGQCNDLTNSLQIAKERKWITTFMDSIAMGDNLSIYGEKNINYCLINGLIQTLIVHEDISDIDNLESLCSKFNTELVIITNFLPEANQIKIGFGGKVGLLRYPVELPDELFDSDDSDDSDSNSNESI
jgi:peptide chain release factor subunit 1